MSNNIVMALNLPLTKDTLISVTRYYKHTDGEGKIFEGKVTVDCDKSGRPKNRLWKARTIKESVRARYWDELYDDAYEAWKMTNPEMVSANSAFKRSRQFAIDKANYDSKVQFDQWEAKQKAAEKDLEAEELD